ncbi:MAG TPA: enolase C-terminal domain-like protein, partial [Bryobacterales bacterium]|nr:enolase C-terminal domain-like protein [Bryobacterales bacterium]
MNRRDWMKALGAGGAVNLSQLLAGHRMFAAPAPQEMTARRGLPPLKITDIKTFLTAPNHIRLVVVKVLTSEPGLYGLGCATFTQRAKAVVTAVDEFLRPFLIGKNPDDIEDIWQSCYVSSYWRNGPVLNNAISGVDQALWDIKGKRANMPVYQLLGGKARFAVDLYAHAQGRDFQEAEDGVRRWMEQGYRHVRVQVAIPGQAAYGAGGGGRRGRGQAAQEAATGPLAPDAKPTRGVFESGPYVRTVPKLFEHLRSKIGWDIELLHDAHERVTPTQAIEFAKALEPYKLFYLEDVLSPEDIAYFRIIRQQCSTPLAMGELFNSPHEFTGLISDRLIDYIRIHISQIGGLTPARKVAALGEWFNVRTAWHGPGDVSPVGHCANIALDVSCYNFGIQEQTVFPKETQEVFPGCPKIKDGYYWVNEAPGWG